MSVTTTTRRRATLLAACAFGLTAAAIAPRPAAAQSDTSDGKAITVEVNGAPVDLSQAQPQMLGGRVMVPVRGVFERLGGKVQWEPQDRAVTGSRADGANPFRMEVGSSDALLNGETTRLEASPRMVSESVYVPLRFVSEALGAKVQWDAASRAVRIVPAAESNANAATATPPSETHDNRASNTPGESDVAAASPPGPDAATNSGSDTSSSSSDERGEGAAGAMVGGAGSGSGTPSSPSTANGGDTAQMERAAPAGATRPAGTDASTAAAQDEATQSPLSRYLPWILGAVVLLGLLGYLATRNKAGQVIASGENVSETKSRRS